MRPGNVETGCRDGTDPDLSDELGGGLIHQGGEGLGVVCDLVIEVDDAAGHSSHYGPGTRRLDSPVGAVTEPGVAC